MVINVQIAAVMANKMQLALYFFFTVNIMEQSKTAPKIKSHITSGHVKKEETGVRNPGSMATPALDNTHIIGIINTTVKIIDRVFILKG